MVRKPSNPDIAVARFEHDGEEYVVVSVPDEDVGAKLAALTDAERAVARLLANGLTNAQIAAHRRTALRTVANQVAAILRKLGASSRSQVGAMFPPGARSS